MNDLDELHDEVAAEIDKRKIERLIEEGVITSDDLANAKTYIMTSHCDCDQPPDENDRCPKCLTKWTKELADE